MANKTGNIAHGLSISPELLEDAKERARSQGRNFSSHICFLLRLDIYGDENYGRKSSRKRDR